MNFLPSLTAWQFAAAGAICALGPLIIHLLNRRRYRVVQWAAMDFLREAMQRNRRIMHLRDILLLMLRTAAVLLFGLALARPYFASSTQAFDDRQPLHAILLIDNSLSMGYESLSGNLLARAKDRARELIDKLPTGSKISIIPVCGARDDLGVAPHASKDNAVEYLGHIELVDRPASILRAVNDARQAAESMPDLAHRIVYIGDRQGRNWGGIGGESLQRLPSMQVVDVSPAEWENTWISDIRLQDGLADVETPTTIVVELKHRGATPRQNLLVTLAAGDTVIGEKTITLGPGLGSREVDFEHTFNALSELPEPDKPIFVPLRASIAPDHLPLDDERFVAAPVVAALPVVFIDQYGEENEDPIRNRLGETRHLRKLLAPKSARSDAPRQLVHIRHITLRDLTQDILADARLVVIAGVPDPSGHVELLRDYVKQGGQLLIAAGAGFDPAAWNETAWADGAGILPAPLRNEPFGEVPELAGANVKPFFLAFESLRGQSYFDLANVSENELRDLYAEPFFFKAVEADLSAAALAAFHKSEQERLSEEFGFITAAQQRKVQFELKEAKGQMSDADRRQAEDDLARMRELRPRWLSWAAAGDVEALPRTLPEDPATHAKEIRALVQKQAPRALARFVSEQGPPFLIERGIGRGRVLLATSGLLSSWNTLPKTNAILIFDRILRSMTESTLPQRNYAAAQRVTLPLPSDSHDLSVELFRPGRTDSEPLDIGYIGTEQRGVTVPGIVERGIYRVVGQRRELADVAPPAAGKVTEAAFSTSTATVGASPTNVAWEISLVANGDSDESDLDSLSPERMDQIASESSIRWVGPGEEISLAGAAIRGQHTWWYLIFAILLLLLAEMLVLAWPMWKAQPVSSVPNL